MRLTLPWIVAASVCLVTEAAAALGLGVPFSDHMVLQRGKPVPVWGKATPGRKVTVAFAGQRASAMASADGSWQVKLRAMPASATAHPLHVTCGSDALTLQDVLVGDVWVASGQSNMQWPLRQCAGGTTEIPASADSGLRLCNHIGTLHPGNKKYGVDFLRRMTKENYYANGGWQVCSPASSAGFSGVAYYFGKALRRETRIPVGLINYAVGGSPVEAHISPAVMRVDPTLRKLLGNWLTNPDYPQWCRMRAKHNLANWLADKTLARHSPPHPFAPHFLWDAGIARLLPFPVKGVIWYQGESNASADGVPADGALNKRKFKALVKSWRTAWRDPSLPVYYVQLPGLNRPWAAFREMQLEASREIPNVGMAVSIDLGSPSNVHPTRKKPVGERLARLALAGVYGKNIVPNGPIFRRASFKKSGVLLEFENAHGMRASDGGKIRGFEVAGSNKVFHPATAVVKGTRLYLASGKVRHPVAVRYAWANDPDCNLVNRTGLPASPFRTDRWKGIRPSTNIERKNR